MPACTCIRICSVALVPVTATVRDGLRIDHVPSARYIATNDVFVPTRGSRFVFGLYPSSNKFWAGEADFTGASD